MSNRKRFKLHAVLTTTSPLHIAAPGPCYFNMAESRTQSYKPQGANEKDFIQATGVQKLNIPETRLLPRDEQSSWRPTAIPVLAANNITGHLRRQAGAILVEHFKRTDQKLDIETFNVLFCGAATGNPDSEQTSFAEFSAAEQDLYIGLMGGGPKMFRRSVRMNGGVPLTPETEFMFHGLEHPGEDYRLSKYRVFNIKELLQGWFMKRGEPLQDPSTFPLGLDVIPDVLEQAHERKQVISAERQAKLANKDDPNRDKTRTKTYSIAGIEFVIPGVEFPLVFDLDGTDAHAGFLLTILDRFAASVKIGGYSRNGFGSFVLREVALVEEGQEPIFDVFQNGRLDTTNQALDRHLGAFRKALETYSAEALTELVAPSKKKGKPAAEEEVEVEAA